MFPTSVEPRAKKKMTLRQPDSVNSFEVVPTDWRILSSVAGAAKAVAMTAARARNFMLCVSDELNEGKSEWMSLVDCCLSS